MKVHYVWSMKHEGWSSLKDKAAYRPHHTCRAAGRYGPLRLKWGESEGITQTGRGTYWLKFVLKGWYRLWWAEKDVHVCAVNTVKDTVDHTPTPAFSVDSELLRYFPSHADAFCRAMLCKRSLSRYAVSLCVCVRHLRALCQNEETYLHFFHHG